ncbi:MAG: hypothetical protein ACOX7I_09725 [Oscillospiraceae bacterium]
MKEHLSLSQRIRNAAASQEVENVKALHAYYHARADATSEWTQIWSRSDDVSWAHGFGRMRGFDQVWFGTVTHYDKMAFENWLKMYEIYPKVGGKDPRPLMEASVHTLVTDVIETFIYDIGYDFINKLWLIISFDNGIVSGYTIDVS